MRAFKLLPVLALMLALTSLALPVASLGDPQSSSADVSQVNPQAKPPSDEEIRTRAEKFISNQHRDDEALEQYERVEHHVDRTAGMSPRTLEDRVYRVVPTGGGTAKIMLRDGDKPVDAATYNRQMQNLKDVLETMANPNDPKAKAAFAKRAKHDRDRAEFVDAARTAFRVKWLGTSAWHGRTCDIFELDPSPDFRPHGIFQDALVHVTAKIWVDRETNQMARGEAQVMSDISFGGGILGKLYRGGVVSMEQAEVAPGIWLPTRYQYDFAGRKFLFSFEEHEVIEASHYRRVGTPSEALLLVQDELASGKTFLVDP